MNKGHKYAKILCGFKSEVAILLQIYVVTQINDCIKNEMNAEQAEQRLFRGSSPVCSDLLMCQNVKTTNKRNQSRLLKISSQLLWSEITLFIKAVWLIWSSWSVGKSLIYLMPQMSKTLSQ